MLGQKLFGLYFITDVQSVCDDSRVTVVLFLHRDRKKSNCFFVSFLSFGKYKSDFHPLQVFSNFLIVVFHSSTDQVQLYLNKGESLLSFNSLTKFGSN